MKRIACLLPGLMLFLASHAQRIQLKVDAGDYDRYHTPVTVSLQQPLTGNNLYTITNTSTGNTATAQLLDGHTLVFILPDSLPAHQTALYRLTAGTASAATTVMIEKNADGLLAKVAGKPVFLYHTAPAQPPAGAPGYYQRSGFIHPLYSPHGEVLTDGFPEGHMHQHGIFNAWVNTTFKGQPVDFWNQPQQTGDIEHIAVQETINGPVAGQCTVTLRHKSMRDGEILRERWTITVYPFTDYFLFDLESVQTNTSSDTLFINEYRYGGLAYRGSREWNAQDSAHFTGKWHLLTSAGKDLSTANHTPARWVDTWGWVGNEETGLAVFDHPQNFRYPQMMRVHPTMPYWCFAPAVSGPFYIAPGQSFRSRYRYFVHTGTVTSSQLETIARNWATPPVAEVTPLR